ncbi:MAG: hypothetical protein H6978_08170 [Gammaproteobacteria bacterium]|nr:hypothetical protein [Gammaproteobacteria bacterium]
MIRVAIPRGNAAWALLLPGVAVTVIVCDLWLAGPPIPMPEFAPHEVADVQSAATAPARELTRIPQWSLFGAEVTPSAAEQAVPVVDVSELPDSTIPAVLAGVLASPDSSSAWAIIDADGTQQRHYRAGDALPGGAVVESIQNRIVVIERGGKREALRLREDRGSGPAPPVVVDLPQVVVTESADAGRRGRVAAAPVQATRRPRRFDD